MVLDFLLFGVTLACVAIFHRHTLAVALTGLGAIIVKKVLWDGFDEGAGLSGLLAHFAHEWVLLANLFLLLVGFALLARHFEASRIPDWMPAILPDDWRGAFVLLALIFVVSSFLDNIAGALIGATVAGHVFRTSPAIPVAMRAWLSPVSSDSGLPRSWNSAPSRTASDARSSAAFCTVAKMCSSSVRSWRSLRWS